MAAGWGSEESVYQLWYLFLLQLYLLKKTPVRPIESSLKLTSSNLYVTLISGILDYNLGHDTN